MLNKIEYYKAYLEVLKKIKIIAHRGNVGSLIIGDNAVDNSKEAIAQALMRSYIDGIEVDVILTKDDKLAAIHYEKLKALSGMNLNVSDLTMKELNQIEVHDHFLYEKGLRARGFLLPHPIKNYKRISDKITNTTYTMELNEMLEIFDAEKREGIYLNKEILIELKGEKYGYGRIKYANEALIEIVGNHKNKNIAVQSYNEQAMTKFKIAHTDIKTGLLVNNFQQKRLKKEYMDINSAYDFYSVMWNWPTIKKMEVLAKHGKGLKFWTLDSLRHYQLAIHRCTRAQQLGIELPEIGLISNIPDQLIGYLAKGIEKGTNQLPEDLFTKADHQIVLDRNAIEKRLVKSKQAALLFN